MKTGVELKLFERKLEFWNLFENWSLENYLKMEILRIGILKIKFEKNWNFENYLRIGVLKIKFKNWNFWNYLSLEFWKLILIIGNFEKLNFGIQIWRIKKKDKR